MRIVAAQCASHGSRHTTDFEAIGISDDWWSIGCIETDRRRTDWQMTGVDICSGSWWKQSGVEVFSHRFPARVSCYNDRLWLISDINNHPDCNTLFPSPPSFPLFLRPALSLRRNSSEKRREESKWDDDRQVSTVSNIEENGKPSLSRVLLR